MSYKTQQESFWSGDFGDAYTKRNNRADTLPALLAFWSRIVGRTNGVKSVIELGANVGLNLQALRGILPDATLSAIEINKQAAEELVASRIADHVHNASILDFKPSDKVDLAFTSGVLIHIASEELPSVYKLLNEVSRRYIVVAEYYNPTPMSVPYRGHDDRLFKRDFAGDILELFPHIRIVDYGFVYRRDPMFPLDDITWFLLEKPQ